MAAPRVALYLHVPFCRTKCDYCDFSSATNAGDPLPDEGIAWVVRRDLGDDATLADAYCEAVPLYLQEFVDRGLLGSVPSVYVGGGTPTALGDRLPAMLERVLSMVTLEPGAEVTVEANPDSLTPELIAALIAAGATRFSLGVQSFDDATLADLGRCHDSAQALAACRMLADASADFSVDLMCGVPGLSAEAWERTLDTALQTGADHLSVYPLSVECGTPLDARIDEGTAEQPDPDEAAAQMALAEKRLLEAGFERYEVASYARGGRRARHNVGYWTGMPYLGVGPGASSMLPVPLAHLTPMDHYTRTWPETWRARFILNDTLMSFLGYLWDRQPASLEPLTDIEAVREDAMLGLRLSDGITEELAEKAGVVTVLESLAGRGLVEQVDGHWRTTRQGWLLGNEVFSAVWAGE